MEELASIRTPQRHSRDSSELAWLAIPFQLFNSCGASGRSSTRATGFDFFARYRLPSWPCRPKMKQSSPS
ncbi:hypothetical protein BV22DRAFT_1029852 [Leucogyrophana mollusca]|uniref:Uncharacterized protein n=1 Tax=Leucogyrophana mollusca TaxID=85980 RepID=A0ACB8BVF5_9AGAM|nr:hypothetical protein BV22DRAFT_1029852 [Leucogyrophana mollusca]